MKLVASFLFILTLNLGFGQTVNQSTITILGKYEYKEKCVGYVLKIKILDETNKCDANYPMSSEEKLKHLQEFIKAKNYSIISINALNGIFSNNSTLLFDVILRDLNDLNSLKLDCDNLGISTDGIKYYYNPNDFSDEDQRAKLAYDDAYNKALMYCKQLGLKLKGINNIDDLTSFGFKPLNVAFRDSYNTYQTKLYNFGRTYSSFFTFNQIWYVEERKTGYTLKVVFNVE